MFESFLREATKPRQEKRPRQSKPPTTAPKAEEPIDAAFEVPPIDAKSVEALEPPSSSLECDAGAVQRQETAGAGVEGESGTGDFRGLSTSQLESMLIPPGAPNLPGMKSNVKLSYHQLVFEAWALARLFQDRRVRPWGGLMLMDVTGFGKTVCVLALYGILLSELDNQRAGGVCSRSTPMLCE